MIPAFPDDGESTDLGSLRPPTGQSADDDKKTWSSDSRTSLEWPEDDRDLPVAPWDESARGWSRIASVLPG